MVVTSIGFGIPFQELKRYGVDMTPLPELPNDPWGQDFQDLLRLIAQYDLVVVQRTTTYAVMYKIREACDILRKPLVYETDDDYLHIPESNPCHRDMCAPERQWEYREMVKMADAVTVSTEQLKNVLYPYNKNIHVFPNNVESVFCGDWGGVYKAYHKEEQNEQGNAVIRSNHGMVNVPAYFEQTVIDGYTKKEVSKEKKRVIRVGYTGTPTHKEDFETIKYVLDKLVDKYYKKIWLVFIGDRYFYDQMHKGRGRVIPIDNSNYHMYLYQIRNLDIGIAPLTPNIFNMSKSPIKAVEYGSWGIPAVLPNLITYNREFTNGKNALFYNNSREFSECLEELINNDSLRENLGRGARDHVQQNRLEKYHAKARYEFYRGLVESRPRFKMFVSDASERSNNGHNQTETIGVSSNDKKD